MPTSVKIRIEHGIKQNIGVTQIGHLFEKPLGIEKNLYNINFQKDETKPIIFKSK